MEIIQLVPFKIAFQIRTKDDEFIVNGIHVVNIFRNKSISLITNENIGSIQVLLKDGSEYKIAIPTYLINSPLGKPYLTLDGKLQIDDIKKKMFCRVTFMKKQEQSFEPNKCLIKIYKVHEGEEFLVQEGKGYYGRYIQFDDLIYFRQVDPLPDTWSQKGLLPSDTLRRKAIRLLQDKELSQADKQLDKDEEEDFHNSKLRTKGTKKGWFK